MTAPMTTHTPGPWLDGQDQRGKKRVYAERHEIVRALSTHGTRKLPEAERTANRRLIAAAPDMLAALKKMVADFEADIEGFDEDDVKYRAFETARAAIAKAEGAP
jgi:hypothetical protein